MYYLYNYYWQAEWVIQEKKPKTKWPSNGCVEFRGYGVRYREGLDLVLKGITCTINPREKVYQNHFNIWIYSGNDRWMMENAESKYIHGCYYIISGESPVGLKGINLIFHIKLTVVALLYELMSSYQWYIIMTFVLFLLKMERRCLISLTNLSITMISHQ